MNQILIIEDDKTKLERLRYYFKEHKYIIKESFQAGLLELKQNHLNYQFLILDMTIPLWEKGNNDLGGNYEQFGGEKILREMRRRKLQLPTILFTMFDVFPTKEGNLTFAELDQKFKLHFSDIYVGGVFYNSNEDDWIENLTELIGKIDKR